MKTIFSDSRNYRYSLCRQWEKEKPTVTFIGLNPSIADENEDDPTLTRCTNYAKYWGYGGVCIVNLFAYVATDPAGMKATKDPVGIENDKWIIEFSKMSGLVIAAWGNHGTHLGRAEEIKKMIPNLYCLSVNKSGEPTHPLYLKSDLKPKPLT